MSAAAAHLRREAREHRAALVLVGALTALVACGSRAFGGLPGGDGWRRPWWCAFFAATAGALAVLPGLFGGELAPDRLRFLARLPASPSATFGRKILFFAASFVGLAAVGAALGAATAPAGSLGDGGAFFDGSLALLLVPALGGWPVVASLFAPGAAALPAAAVLAALVAAPSYATYRAGVYAPDATELAALWAGFAAAPWIASAVAWIGPLGRFGDRRRGAMRAALALLLCALPAWTRAGSECAEKLLLDPTDDDVVFTQVLLSTDGGRAYLTALDLGGGAAHALMVDLRTGDWNRAGGIGSAFVASTFAAGPSGLHAGVGRMRSVELLDEGELSVRWNADRGVPAPCATAAVGIRRPLSPEIAADLLAAAACRDAEGRPWAYSGGKLVALSGDGSPGPAVWDADGVQWGVVVPGDWVLLHAAAEGNAGRLTTAAFDPLRGRVVPHPKGLDRPFPVETGWCGKKAPASASTPYALLPFDGAASRPAAGLTPTDVVVARAEVARLLVLRATNVGRRTFALVAPETGVVEELLDAHGQPFRCDGVEGADIGGWTSSVRRTASGDLLFAVEVDGRTTLARCRVAARRIDLAPGASVPRQNAAADAHPATGEIAPLAVDGDVVHALVGGRRLVRAEFGSDRAETLFPR